MNPVFYLLDTNVTGTSADYAPIGIQLIFAAGFVATMMIATHLSAQKEKQQTNLKILQVE